MPALRFSQVDVFGAQPYTGNPLAVVHDADDLDSEQMQRFARWTNLSETTFLLQPSGGADYRVRIFTPERELPFAGHPTLGSAHAWLEAGGIARDAGEVVQECGLGLVPVRRVGAELSFAAPPLRRFGPVEETELARLAAELHLDRSAIVDASWLVNGPEWVGLLLADGAAVRSVRPGAVTADIGLAGIDEDGLEVRALCPKNGTTDEDPVTGSLNAGLAQWLVGSGRLGAPYTARQGRVIGRDGRIDVTEVDGNLWIGGATRTCVAGSVTIGVSD